MGQVGHTGQMGRRIKWAKRLNSAKWAQKGHLAWIGRLDPVGLDGFDRPAYMPQLTLGTMFHFARLAYLTHLTRLVRLTLSAWHVWRSWLDPLTILDKFDHLAYGFTMVSTIGALFFLIEVTEIC